MDGIDLNQQLKDVILAKAQVEYDLYLAKARIAQLEAQSNNQTTTEEQNNG